MLNLKKVETMLLSTDITQLAASLGMLHAMRRSAAGYYGQCPFCHAKERKFHFYRNHGRQSPDWFRCYRPSCNAHGDAIELIRKTEGLNFRQAVAWLARYNNIDLGKLQEGQR